MRYDSAVGISIIEIWINLITPNMDYIIKTEAFRKPDADFLEEHISQKKK